MEEKRKHIRNVLKEVIANPPSGNELDKKVDLILNYMAEDLDGDDEVAEEVEDDEYI